MIIIGLVFALLCYKKTWYPSWAFLFNILISIYIGIMTAPQIVDKIPFIRERLNDFAYSAGILAVAVIIFIVVQFLSVRFLIAGHRASFPKILNSIGAAVLGFVAGLIITGFLFFLINITPLPNWPAVDRFFAQHDRNSEKASSFVLGPCNFVHSISFHAQTVGVEKQMEKILTDWKSPETELITKPANPDPNNIEIAE